REPPGEILSEAKDPEEQTMRARREDWWTWSGSNRRPLPCHGSALPAAPQAHSWTQSIVSDPGKIVKRKKMSRVKLKRVSILNKAWNFFSKAWNFLHSFASSD